MRILKGDIEQYPDAIALVTNDIRETLIERDIDPFEQGVYRAIAIIARAIQGGDIAAYGQWKEEARS